MRFLILLLVLLVAGCDNPLGPELPPSAEPTLPGRSFAGLWDEVETDAGVTGDFDAISWYMVPGSYWLQDGTAARGMWVKDGNRIYIASAYWGTAGVVRHEMLHAILRDPDHDNPLFETPRYNSPWFAL